MLGPPRLATAADVPLLAALYADAARTLGPLVYSPAQVAAWVSFGADTAAFRDYILSAQTWIAGDPPQAFCGIDAGGEVHSLYVAPARTRQGVGSTLLVHAMAQARAQGVTQFSAWATPFSRPVFQRAGLQLVQTVTEPYQGVLFERYRLAST
jgi:GNAT superfamily N-acetyltransferase